MFDITVTSVKVLSLKEATKMLSVSKITRYATIILHFTIFCNSVASGENVHVSVKNRLGDGTSLSIHCQSKDTDIGDQTVTDGNEIGWDFSPNAWGTTLFYCDVTGWGGNSTFSFDIYAHDRDWLRCESQCLWLISKEGMYGLNGVTGFWEFLWNAPAS
ncbi:Self-incompatibility protein s1 [Thalictrum thalictroides]|uniref:S-protein homolog n=1 Tax=Thalictrum thalictroides TaxID=46969 RepID=A0A7J6WI68_THATH|nr:Self-incompatibility protein s1 [Thalictrum thalictroides]